MDCINRCPTQCRPCAFQNALKSFAERTDKLFVFLNYPFPRKRWLERSSGPRTFLLEADAFDKSELSYDPIILCNLVSLLPDEAAKLDDWMQAIYQAAESWLRRTMPSTERLEKCREIRIDVLAVQCRKYRDLHNLENQIDEIGKPFTHVAGGRGLGNYTTQIGNQIYGDMMPIVPRL